MIVALQLISSWRRKAREVIAQALADGRELGLEGLQLRAFVRKQYPFGEPAFPAPKPKGVAP